MILARAARLLQLFGCQLSAVSFQLPVLHPNTPGLPIAGMGTVQEGRFVDGKWVFSRQLTRGDTGQDTRLSLRCDRAPQILRVKPYRYE